MPDGDPDHEGDTASGTTSGSDGDDSKSGETDDADTFGVGIHVTDTELQFVVHVPSSIAPGWTDPEAFQRLVEQVVWNVLDREETLRSIAASASTGETVTLGTVTLRPDETVVDHSLSAPDTTEDTTDDGRR
jgi:hypothetical protein